MKVKPLHDWAVIRPSLSAERTASGLYIPDTAKERPQEGMVEAIGPGAFEEEKRRKKKGEKKERRFVPTVVKPGDRVVYAKYAGQTYNAGGEEIVLVRERDILGILPTPLQIPAATSSEGETALMKSAVPAATEKAKAAKKLKAEKKPPVKKTKKAAKKSAKKQGTKKKASVKPAKTKTVRRVKAKKARKKK